MTIRQRLYPFIRPELRSLIGAAVLLMTVAGVNLAILWIARRLIDVITVERDVAALPPIIGLLTALFFGQTVLTMGHSYLMARIGQRVTVRFKIALFSHLQRLSLDFFTQRRTGELLSRLTSDVGVIQNISTNVPVDLAKQTVTLIGASALLLYMNWRLCVLILAIVPFVIVVARLFGKRLRRLSTQVQDRTADTSTIVEETISGIRIVKSFLREGHEISRFSRGVEQLMRSALRRALVLALFIPTITFFTLVGAAAVVWYGGAQVIRGAMSPGDLMAFVLYGGILMGPFSSVARVFTQVREVQGATQRVFEILDVSPRIADAPEARVLPPVRGAVTFRDVHFGYDGSPEVLRGVSFEAEPGQLVALVGPSGAGKTTLVNLLHRFYDPAGGRIEIDGHDLRTVRLDSLYRQIALVPQETVLFGGTIRENIRYGRLEATEEELIAASRAANAHGFIASLPRGYDMVVGEKGVNLSGGQRQRIAIARAILKNPRILILDEATSSLDNESEALIREALDHLMRGRTTFVIAHRLTTVQSADLILVLDRGEIVERGTHAQLLDRRGLYHHLYTIRLAGIAESG